jgi:hypothetical protein
MDRIGFSECTKLILYNKIDGKAIKNQKGNDIFTETLGITQDIELDKLVYNIDLFKEERVDSQALFGWGGNSFG